MLANFFLDSFHAEYSLQVYFGCLLVFIVIVQNAFYAASIYRNRPRSIPLLGPSLGVGKWWSSLRFMLAAPTIIKNGYEKTKYSGSKFAIPSREAFLTFVSSEEHIREVESASQEQLSFHAAVQERLKLKYTFNGFEIGMTSIDPHDTVALRVLKTLLRIDIPLLRPRIQAEIERVFKSSIAHVKQLEKGWSQIDAMHLAEEISQRMNCKVIFGDRLGGNKEFISCSQWYHRQAVAAMLTAHYFPNFMDKYVVPAIMWAGGAMRKMDKMLTREVELRIADFQNGKEVPRDAITWVLEASTNSDQRQVKRLVQQIFAIYFASAHQLPVLTMFAMYRLGQHPEYIQPLVDEAEAMLKLPEAEQWKSMPLMESFLREAARYDPLDSLSVQRKVLKDFQFADGGVVPAGNTICVPQQAVMRDPEFYERPDEFLPFRFIADSKDRDELAEQKFTDLKPHFYLWGAAKNPCPGRWYASAALKQIFVHLLTNYNFKLADRKAGLTITYTTIVYPRPGLQLVLQPRH